MRINTAKQKILEGNPAFGYALSLGSPTVAEVLGQSGIDFVMADTQHGSFGPDSTIATFTALAAGSAVPMARVARNDFTMIGRLLDEGALGVVVPMVDTLEDAKMAAHACRFPPTGGRSWGWGRARSYGDDYGNLVDEEIFVAVQIESIQAVNQAEAIMSVPGIDGCWIGPADLALSMGIHPDHKYEDDDHARALEKVLEACRNTGKAAGIASVSVDEALQRAREGYRFLTAGSDISFLLDGALAGVKALGR
jgi:4-hydroxy-2-oxoheptanedioate aldolase